MCERASYARTIAYVVEHIRLVHAPAPEPHHVLVPVAQERQPRAVVVRPQRRQEVVRRDPVRACVEHTASALQIETSTLRAGKGGAYRP